MNPTTHGHHLDSLAWMYAPEHGVSQRVERVHSLISNRDAGTSKIAYQTPQLITLREHSTSNGCLPNKKEIPRCDAEEKITHGDKICEVRRLSGLTWEQMARIFDVSSGDVLSWVSGKQMDEIDRDRLDNLLETIRYINRGAPDMTKPVLLTAGRDGDTPYDLLTKGLFDEVAERVGPGNAKPYPKLPPIDPAEWKWKLPLPPECLVGALHDPIHKDTGEYRPVRVAKIKSTHGGEKR